MGATLIGSRALSHWFEDARYPHDWDLLVTKDVHDAWVEQNRHIIRDMRKSREDKLIYILSCGAKIETEIAREPSVSVFIELSKDCPIINIFGIPATIAPPSSLLALKRSHIYWPHNWHKHIMDYHFLKRKGVVMDNQSYDAYKMRLKEKKVGNPDKTIFSLNVPNDEFFDASEASLCRFFEHDDIHAATCYYDEPLYKKAKRDTTKAMVDRELFEAMSFEDQCRMVQEEAFVIALERRIIPHLMEPPIPGEPLIDVEVVKHGFDYAIMRICTTLTRGWFREFAIENFPTIYKHNVNFVKKFLQALKDGKIRERKKSDGQS